MRKPSLLVIFLTVFIDLVGFGIVVPLVPLYSRHFGVEGVMMGLIIASFSAMQFIFSPIWGRLSDKYGRRPILLFSTAGAALSYVLFAYGSGLPNHTWAVAFLVISRSFAGLCGGNITVAQAYMADITPPDKRSKGMGLIGMAFGLGFIFGPIIGGLSLKHMGDTGPGWVAAALCAFNFLLAFAILKESRNPSSEHVPARPALQQWRHSLSQPKIATLIVTFFIVTFCFSCFESTLALVVSDNFKLDVRDNASASSVVVYLFAYCGILGAFIQGGAIGRLVKMWGEPKLILISLVLSALSFAPLPFIKGDPHFAWANLVRPEGLPWVFLLGALALLTIGTSLTRPPLFGYLSLLTPTNEQGSTIGVAQSAGSLARIAGPIFATSLLKYQPALPYVVCSGILLLTAVVTGMKLGTHVEPAGNAAAEKI